MCKICEMRTAINASQQNSVLVFDSLAQLTMAAMGLLIKLKARGIEFDKDEEKAYEELHAFLNLDDTPEANVKEAFLQTLKQAFPGAQVHVVTSPQDAEAILNNITGADKDRTKN